MPEAPTGYFLPLRMPSSEIYLRSQKYDKSSNNRTDQVKVLGRRQRWVQLLQPAANSINTITTTIINQLKCNSIIMIWEGIIRMIVSKSMVQLLPNSSNLTDQPDKRRESMVNKTLKMSERQNGSTAVFFPCLPTIPQSCSKINMREDSNHKPRQSSSS